MLKPVHDELWCFCFPVFNLQLANENLQLIFYRTADLILATKTVFTLWSEDSTVAATRLTHEDLKRSH